MEKVTVAASVVCFARSGIVGLSQGSISRAIMVAVDGADELVDDYFAKKSFDQPLVGVAMVQ